MLKTLMAGKQGCCEKAGDVGSLADIDSNIQEFLGQQGSMSQIDRK